jgi:NAD(P)-dependent dehydrogenase (short-subunit alcohol dehydrogenase family)
VNPVYDFAGQVALVTGAASGIGRAAASAFAASGADLVLLDRDAELLRAAQEMLTSAGAAVHATRCDVADEAEVRRAVESGVDRFGRLDMAFNAAGVIGPRADAGDQDAAGYDRLMGVNARGTWACMKYEIRAMRGRGGAIVNCASLAGLVGGAGYSAYHASKHAVVGMTRSAALEYAARGIRINAVCPGVIDTPMVSAMLSDHSDAGAVQAATAAQPIGRLGRPEEVAAAALWLCSSAASLVVGVALPIDGGYVAQ